MFLTGYVSGLPDGACATFPEGNGDPGPCPGPFP